jgi:hypothetical protein
MELKPALANVRQLRGDVARAAAHLADLETQIRALQARPCGLQHRAWCSCDRDQFAGPIKPYGSRRRAALGRSQK